LVAQYTGKEATAFLPVYYFINYHTIMSTIQGIIYDMKQAEEHMASIAEEEDEE
jgi:hypothetical protein